MINKIAFFCAALLLAACQSQTPQSAELDGLVPTDSLFQQAFEQSAQQPERAEQLYLDLGAAYQLRGNYPKAGICFLNAANLADERQAAPDRALQHAERSYQNWSVLQDTMQMANLKKYTGLLRGKLEQFKPAFADLDTARIWYISIPFPQGIAITDFNEAQVYYQAKEYKLAQGSLIKAQRFWRTQGNQRRVFINNIFGLRLFHQMNHQGLIDFTIEENEEILKTTSINQWSKDQWESVKSALLGN
ncbi:MAG: hypothetical protein AAF598_01550 [Bacteroidota bacterium]